MLTNYTNSDSFKVIVIDSSGNTYPSSAPYYYDTQITSDEWNIQQRYTDKSFMLSLYDYQHAQEYTLMFMYDTLSFVFLPQPSLTMVSIDDVRSTYPG